MNTKTNNTLKNHHKSIRLLVFLMKSLILSVRMKMTSLQLQMIMRQKICTYNIQTMNHMNITQLTSHLSTFYTFQLNQLYMTQNLACLWSWHGSLSSRDTFCRTTIQYKGRNSRCHQSFPYCHPLHVQGSIFNSIKSYSAMCS